MMNDESKEMLREAGGYRNDYRIGLDGVQRYVMPLFLIVDTSGSMRGHIAQVRNAIENIKLQLSKHNRECSASVIKVSVLCFDDAVRWECFMEEPDLVGLDCKLGIGTEMGAALKKLNDKLCGEVMIKQNGSVGYKRAVFLLLSDGCPTDDIERPIRALRSNKWFVKGSRIGIAIGEDADTGALVRFTGANGNVLKLCEDNLDCLESILENVAIVASSTNSRANDLDMQRGFDDYFEVSARETAKILSEARRKYHSKREFVGNCNGQDPFGTF